MAKTTRINELAAEFMRTLEILEEGVKIDESTLGPVHFEKMLVQITEKVPETASGALVAYRSGVKKYNATKLSKKQQEELKAIETRLEELDQELDALESAVWADYAPKIAEINWRELETARDVHNQLMSEIAVRTEEVQVDTRSSIEEQVQKKLELANLRRNAAKIEFCASLGMKPSEHEEKGREIPGSRKFSGFYASNPWKTGQKSGTSLYNVESGSFWYEPAESSPFDSKWVELGKVELTSATMLQRFTYQLGSYQISMNLEEAFEKALEDLKGDNFSQINAGGVASTVKLTATPTDDESQREYSEFTLPDEVTVHFEKIAADLARIEQKREEIDSRAKESGQTDNSDEESDETAESDENDAESGNSDENSEEDASDES